MIDKPIWSQVTPNQIVHVITLFALVNTIRSTPSQQIQSSGLSIRVPNSWSLITCMVRDEARQCSISGAAEMKSQVDRLQSYSPASTISVNLRQLSKIFLKKCKNAFVNIQNTSLDFMLVSHALYFLQLERRRKCATYILSKEV